MRLRLTITLFYLCTMDSMAMSKDELYEINLAKKDSSVRASVFNEKKQIKTKPELTYYWFAYNQIHHTLGGYDGRLLHGPYACFYPNGNLKQKGNYRSGLKTGQWIRWYESGIIAEISHWVNGSKQGSFRTFDIAGLPLLDACYKNGKLNGTVSFYEAGKVTSVKKYKMGNEVLPKVKKIKTPKSHKPSKENTTVSPKEPQERKGLLDRFKRKRKAGGKDGEPKLNVVKKE